MCKAPIWIPVASSVTGGVWVKCKACTWCKGNRVNDWAGRCVAEQQNSTAIVSCTLTYAKVTADADLTELYRDVQLMLKRLRKDGYSVRYLVAGEHGERKGRVHWHAILFFRGAKLPEVEYNTKFYNWKYWKHGYTYVQSPDFEGMSYVLKYTLKEDDPLANETKVMHCSKFPPIGAEYFQSLAQDYVNARLPVHSPEYSFAHLRLRSGKLRKFWLADRSRELFLGGSERYGFKGYVQLWRDAYGTEPPGTDFLIENYYDPQAAAEVEAERWSSSALSTGEQNGFLLLPAPTLGVVVSYSDGKAVYIPHGLKKGEAPWRIDVGTGYLNAERGAAGRLKQAGLRRDLIRSILAWLTQPR